MKDIQLKLTFTSKAPTLSDLRRFLEAAERHGIPGNRRVTLTSQGYPYGALVIEDYEGKGKP